MRRTSALTVSSFQIENWKFCSNSSDDCESADRGEFIDVTLVIKSRGKPKFRSEEEKEKLLKKKLASDNTVDMEKKRDITITVEMEKKKVHRNTIPGASKGESTKNVPKSLILEGDQT